MSQIIRPKTTQRPASDPEQDAKTLGDDNKPMAIKIGHLIEYPRIAVYGKRQRQGRGRIAFVISHTDANSLLPEERRISFAFEAIKYLREFELGERCEVVARLQDLISEGNVEGQGGDVLSKESESTEEEDSSSSSDDTGENEFASFTARGRRISRRATATRGYNLRRNAIQKMDLQLAPATTSKDVASDTFEQASNWIEQLKESTRKNERIIKQQQKTISFLRQSAKVDQETIDTLRGVMAQDLETIISLRDELEKQPEMTTPGIKSQASIENLLDGCNIDSELAKVQKEIGMVVSEKKALAEQLQTDTSNRLQSGQSSPSHKIDLLEGFTISEVRYTFLSGANAGFLQAARGPLYLENGCCFANRAILQPHVRYTRPNTINEKVEVIDGVRHLVITTANPNGPALKHTLVETKQEVTHNGHRYKVYQLREQLM